MMMSPDSTRPEYCCAKLKKGVVRQLMPATFQSNVGIGLMPIPLFMPVMIARLTLSGAIHEIQLKMLRAWKM